MRYLTKHAVSRFRQRGIPPIADFLLDEFGERHYDGRGGMVIYLSHRSVRRMERAFGRRRSSKMSEYRGIYRVDAIRDGKTITVCHRSKRLRRR